MGEHEASKGIFVETLYARETSLFHKKKKIFLKQVCGETSPVSYFSQRRGKKNWDRSFTWNFVHEKKESTVAASKHFYFGHFFMI